MQKCLITGASGQLAQQLARTLEGKYALTCCDRETLDIADPDAVVRAFADPPDVCINCAAYTQVDKAEQEPARARAINAEGTRHLANACREHQAWLIHISTDYVFGGDRGSPYPEDAPTNPLGVYGATKLEGEVAVREVCPHHVILRTAWVYGAYGKGNFVKTMLRVGAQREELRVVQDQVGTPTWTGSIAEAIAALLPKLAPDMAGTYHFTNSGVASWYDFATTIFEEARALGFPLEVQRVVPITTPEYPTPAKRPAYSVLSGEKLAALLGTKPPHWRDSLRQMLQELKPAVE